MTGWTWRDTPYHRGPPCHHCGLVDPAIGFRPAKFRHECNPTAVQAMKLGVAAVEMIGRAIRDAFAKLAEGER